MRLFRHYKGGLYVEFARAMESTNARQGREVVIYYSLGKQAWHTRDAAEFDDMVDPGDSGGLVQRFALLEVVA